MKKVWPGHSLRRAQGRLCLASVILNSLFAVVLQRDEQQRPSGAEASYFGPFGGTTEVVPLQNQGLADYCIQEES
jgi:hypothetical protein